MGRTYADAEQLRAVFSEMFGDVANDDGMDGLVAQQMVIHFRLHDPSIDIWVDGRLRPVATTFEHLGVDATLTAELGADSMRELLLGTLPLGKGQGWTLATLEVRHRQRARCEDRIRALKDTGLRNLPFAGFAQNPLWAEIVALAADLLTQTLAFDKAEPARRWEPKRLRFRILAVAGRLINGQRRRHLRLPRHWPWNHLIDAGWRTIRTT